MEASAPATALGTGDSTRFPIVSKGNAKKPSFLVALHSTAKRVIIDHDCKQFSESIRGLDLEGWTILEVQHNGWVVMNAGGVMLGQFCGWIDGEKTEFNGWQRDPGEPGGPSTPGISTPNTGRLMLNWPGLQVTLVIFSIIVAFHCSINSRLQSSRALTARGGSTKGKDDLEGWKLENARRREVEAETYLAPQKDARDKGLPIPGLDDKSIGERSPETRRRWAMEDIDRSMPEFLLYPSIRPLLLCWAREQEHYRPK
ncbi:hypothetical protein EDB81DRAFT_829643 [Dactylonectria macrodidyma]|uniref:Uncharacterized protein n=1 Tax=Dactylonectria macrodidyma TaxID=307937 RepID=A0A9P9I8C1_9HYPO|nr:hypothetical protein EDB81DRAFT_829643 [Dactylonectria macrodidyma]